MKPTEGTYSERKRYWNNHYPTHGSYTIDRRAGIRCAEEDPGRWRIWQHIWECRTFQDYHSKAPWETVTQTPRCKPHRVTRKMEMVYCLAMGYVIPC
jgi:hypothetical protein